MISRDLVIVNEKGMHVRPASLLIKSVSLFDSEVTFSKDGKTVPGTDVIGLLSLEALMGSTITVTASGPDEKAAVEEIARVIANDFDFD